MADRQDSVAFDQDVDRSGFAPAQIYKAAVTDDGEMVRHTIRVTASLKMGRGPFQQAAITAAWTDQR
jgi:hypothetical protein